MRYHPKALKPYLVKNEMKNFIAKMATMKATTDSIRATMVFANLFILRLVLTLQRNKKSATR